MPIHEYACQSCRSTALEKKLSLFATQNGTPEPSACGTCGDPRGPGACRFN